MKLEKHNPFKHDPGPRVTTNEDILRIEAEMDGYNNKAIPYKLIANRHNKKDWEELLTKELERDNPRKRVIGYANRKILYYENGGKSDDEAE
jgi:hypothetical protein